LSGGGAEKIPINAQKNFQQKKRPGQRHEAFLKPSRRAETERESMASV
jgi:hypothetical protein